MRFSKVCCVSCLLVGTLASVTDLSGLDFVNLNGLSGMFAAGMSGIDAFSAADDFDAPLCDGLSVMVFEA